MTTKEDFKKINKLYTSEEEERLPDGERVFKKVETKLSMDIVSGLPEAMAEIRVDMLKLIYPIGAIYTSVNNVSPNNLFGGTWVSFGAGKVLVGVDSTDTDYNTVQKTGGSKTNTLAIANLPGHTHSFSATSGNQSANHTHSVGAHSHGLNSHTHSVGAHSHSLNSHTHSIPSLKGTAALDGAHTHAMPAPTWYNSTESSMLQSGRSYHGQVNQRNTGSAGAHTHSVSTTASTTGGASGSTANSTAFNTGGASGSTANSAAFNSGSNSENHTHSVSGTTGSTGSGAAFNTVDPYITVYMWRRTA